MECTMTGVVSTLFSLITFEFSPMSLYCISNGENKYWQAEPQSVVAEGSPAQVQSPDQH